MTQPMQIQSAVIPGREPESMKAIDACSVKTGSRAMHGMTQRGFSLVSAIFLLVVIAALGTFAVTLSTTQHQSAAMDVLGSRAYQAARAGVEWATYHVALSPASSPTAWSGCASNTPLGSLGGTLAPFTVTVNCSPTSHVEGASTIWIYDVSSKAVAGGGPGDPSYVERVISVKMGK